MNTFDTYIKKWNLVIDGDAISTLTSKLLPVQYKSMPAMLKIATAIEEQTSGQLMVWWDGQGSAQVHAHDSNALLMERAMGGYSLIKMAAHHKDEEATRIICKVVSHLHAQTNKATIPSTLTPLSDWFSALYKASQKYEGVFYKSMKIADELLNNPQEVVVLHGDIHHGNVLDFGVRGWLAIDPKGLVGERGYDFANIFCNPNMGIATKPGRLEQQINIVSNATGLNRHRLLKWVLSYAGLSAAWHLEDGGNPELAMMIMSIASAMIDEQSR